VLRGITVAKGAWQKYIVEEVFLKLFVSWAQFPKPPGKSAKAYREEAF
jgi:hypothetical protein